MVHYSTEENYLLETEGDTIVAECPSSFIVLLYTHHLLATFIAL